MTQNVKRSKKSMILIVLLIVAVIGAAVLFAFLFDTHKQLEDCKASLHTTQDSLAGMTLSYEKTSAELENNKAALSEMTAQKEAVDAALSESEENLKKTGEELAAVNTALAEMTAQKEAVDAALAESEGTLETVSEELKETKAALEETEKKLEEVSKNKAQSNNNNSKKGNTAVDYPNDADFEKDLNKGVNMVGKTVTFKVVGIKPNSAFGFNLWAGEHLNFCSSQNPNVSIGDYVTVKVTDVRSAIGSYIIYYELVK